MFFVLMLGADWMNPNWRWQVRNNIQRATARKLQSLSGGFRTSQKDYLRRLHAQKKVSRPLSPHFLNIKWMLVCACVACACLCVAVCMCLGSCRFVLVSDGYRTTIGTVSRTVKRTANRIANRTASPSVKQTKPRAEPNRTEPNRTEPNRTEPNRTVKQTTGIANGTIKRPPTKAPNESPTQPPTVQPSEPSNEP